MDYSVTDVFCFIGAGALILALLAMLLVKFILEVYFPFVGMREDIRAKIIFSESYDERKYWHYEMKILYVRLIPFFGKSIARSMKRKNLKRKNF